VNTVIDLQVPYNAGKFLSSCTTSGFSRSSQLHKVSYLHAIANRLSEIEYSDLLEIVLRFLMDAAPADVLVGLWFQHKVASPPWSSSTWLTEKQLSEHMGRQWCQIVWTPCSPGLNHSIISLVHGSTESRWPDQSKCGSCDRHYGEPRQRRPEARVRAGCDKFEQLLWRHVKIRVRVRTTRSWICGNVK
jgi:hypothetical protein